MPIYTFEHPKTKEVKELFFHMNDNKVYIDEKGVEWKRVYHPTGFSFDTKVDPHDVKAFKRKTERGGTLGDIIDLSKEMSEKRGGKNNDPVKKKYHKEWKKRRHLK